MNCSWGHIAHDSNRIQVYLSEDVFQRKRAFHLDRSQRLPQINSAHLHWNLQKNMNTIIYFGALGLGIRRQEKT